MEKLKLTITNNGCNPIKVFGRPCIDIPAQGTVTTIRPAALIERLRRQYPSLAITTEEEPLPPVEALASTKASSNKAADKAPTQSAPTAKGKAEPAA
jgi:hypothetical protein